MIAAHDTLGGCGSGHCGCGQAEAPAPAAPEIARINGVALHAPGEDLSLEDLRERAWTELLRQEAVRQGLLAAVDTANAPTLSDEDHERVAAMVEEAVPLRAPTAEEARRYYDGHLSRFVTGARARLRHILFAVTPGVDVPALAARAEKALLELSHAGVAPGRFAELARELSNCPSGAEGGELGWVTPQEIAPELSSELFHQPTGDPPMGLRPRLVHSRYGLHVLEVLERDPGRQAPFEEVQERLLAVLAQQSQARAMHQYIRVLAGQARVEGVDLEAASSPLVQ